MSAPSRAASPSHRPVTQSQGSHGGLLMNSKRRPSAAPPHHCFPLLVVATCCNIEPRLPTSEVFSAPPSNATNEGASPAAAFEVGAEGEV